VDETDWKVDRFSKRLTVIVEINNVHDGASSPFSWSTSRRSRAPSAAAKNISALYSFGPPDTADHHPDIETRFAALRERESWEMAAVGPTVSDRHPFSSAACPSDITRDVIFTRKYGAAIAEVGRTTVINWKPRERAHISPGNRSQKRYSPHAPRTYRGTIRARTVYNE
jgi:hypothetical protein